MKVVGKQIKSKTYLELADLLETFATKIHVLLTYYIKPSNKKELRQTTLGDYEALAHIRNYHAEKIC
jgi:hypothetical protein